MFHNLCRVLIFRTPWDPALQFNVAERSQGGPTTTPTDVFQLRKKVGSDLGSYSVVLSDATHGSAFLDTGSILVVRASMMWYAFRDVEVMQCVGEFLWIGVAILTTSLVTAELGMTLVGSFLRTSSAWHADTAVK